MRPLRLFPVLVLLLAGPPLSPPFSRQADTTTTVVSPSGRSISSTGKIYLQRSKVRFEPANSEEIDLFDFEQMKAIRLFPADRIYFESRITPARRFKALQEGWISAAAPDAEKRVFLTEGVVKEKPARLFLFILGEEGRRAYSLRWIAADGAPLRIIYPATEYETVIVDYDHYQTEPKESNLFEPPPGFLNVNPY